MWEKYKALGYPYDAVVGLQGAGWPLRNIFTVPVEAEGGHQRQRQDCLPGMGGGPVPGGNVTLTLDIGMQKVAEDAIAAHAASGKAPEGRRWPWWI